MPHYLRYAIYYCPAQNTALAAFGANWLGWDIHQGTFRDHPAYAGLPKPLTDLTKRPQKYGFHGTLKAPFVLAEGVGETDVIDALEAFSAKTAQINLGRLEVAQLGTFIAFRLVKPSGDLQNLASKIVRHFDPFRAALDPAQREKRIATGLSPAQIALLDEWGYPYVFNEFRFHMTLSGAMNADALWACKQVLDKEIAEILREPMILDRLTLCGQRADGYFEVVNEAALSG
ncbi:MAG: DUF1045 domain-containing protein [Pseudomonadota bacterium]